MPSDTEAETHEEEGEQQEEKETKTKGKKKAKGEKKEKGTKRKAKKEKTGPKRALSAYMFFCKEMRPEVQKANPNAKFAEIGRIMGKQWQEMDEAAKKPYNKMNEKDKERYEAEKAAMPDAPAEEGEGGKKKRAKTTKDGAPRKPKSAYLFFCDEEREKLKAQNTDIESKEMVVMLGANWKKLSEEAKVKYTEMSDAAKKEYKTQLEEYEKVHGPIEKKKKKKEKGEKAEKPKKSKKKKATEEEAGEEADAEAEAPAEEAAAGEEEADGADS